MPDNELAHLLFQQDSLLARAAALQSQVVGRALNDILCASQAMTSAMVSDRMSWAIRTATEGGARRDR